MTTIDLAGLLDILDIEELDSGLFRGAILMPENAHVFGGQVLAQALVAAIRTVPASRRVHSMHAYFLRAGDHRQPIIYEAEAIRDGGSFTTRRVVARQHGKAIFFSSMSFKEQEQGLEHQTEMPAVAGPEQLESDKDYWNRMSPDSGNRFSRRLTAIDSRSLDRRDPGDLAPRDPVQGQWFKACGAIAADSPMHEVLVAFFSDMSLLGTALRAHPVDFETEGLQVTSLDHSIWFHAPIHADDWLYYHMDSPRSSNGTGLNRGSIYSRAGTLLASVSQEGLVRLKKPK
ncbi:MAG: acyl-CoA thioesterase-2 [Paraglaciecola psychrophila]|jgi:acyl-CoA thioesterase-2